MEEKTKQARLHVTIEGRVQGVGFRFFVLEKSVQLGLVGWVRNTVDGKVEVTAEGSQEILNKLLLDLHRGPQAAYITNIQQEWFTATGEFSRFRVVSSGY